MSSISGVRFVLLCFVFVFLRSLKPRPFVQSFFNMHVPRQLHAVTKQLSVFVCFLSLFFFGGGGVDFCEYFCTITVFSLYRETSYVFSFRMVFFYLVTTD